jgi:3-methyladenine DNA glycosylase/8-oxoguanine DNA glycosylase
MMKAPGTTAEKSRPFGADGNQGLPAQATGEVVLVSSMALPAQVDTALRRKEAAPLPDPEARDFLRRADPILARLIDERPDFRPRAFLEHLPPMDGFGTLIFQVIGQQLSVGATRTIMSRLEVLAVVRSERSRHVHTWPKVELAYVFRNASIAQRDNPRPRAPVANAAVWRRV